MDPPRYRSIERAQQIETKDFQIFYTMQAFASQRTTGKQKQFNQLSTQSSSWLFPQFSTLGTFIKSPPSLRAARTKQGTGILAGHNGNPSQRMAGIKSRCLPAAAFPTQLCLFLPTSRHQNTASATHQQAWRGP